jgi:hypothetical protein
VRGIVFSLLEEIVAEQFGKEMWDQLLDEARAEDSFTSSNGIVHREVRKLYQGAGTPEFDFDISSSEVLIMNCRSRRKIYSLVAGFTEGAAAHCNETVDIRHPLCTHLGDECCHLEFSLTTKLS